MLLDISTSASFLVKTRATAPCFTPISRLVTLAFHSCDQGPLAHHIISKHIEVLEYHTLPCSSPTPKYRTNQQAFSLATGLVVYINVTFTLLLAAVLACIPCSRRADVKPSPWDYLKIVAQQE